MPATCWRQCWSERRILKQIQTEDRDRGRVLIYEHAKTGDVFIVPDPQLHLDELDAVQVEVVALMTKLE